jgi:hypothetical protein
MTAQGIVHQHGLRCRQPQPCAMIDAAQSKRVQSHIEETQEAVYQVGVNHGCGLRNGETGGPGERSVRGTIAHISRRPEHRPFTSFA